MNPGGPGSLTIGTTPIREHSGGRIMRSAQFDDLTRRLAAGTSRRTVIRGLAVMLASRPVIGFAAGCAKLGEKCDKETPCCDGDAVGCGDGICVCLSGIVDENGNCGSPPSCAKLGELC